MLQKQGALVRVMEVVVVRFPLARVQARCLAHLGRAKNAGIVLDAKGIGTQL